MMLDQLLDQAVSQNASDLYLKADALPMVRVNGEMTPISKAGLIQSQLEEIVGLLVTPRQREKFEAEKELNLAYKAKSGERFRVNIYQQRGVWGIVFRRISLTIPTIEELNLPLRLKEIAMLRQGLFFVCGPTGSGKSTTLAAMLDYRNQVLSGHIITIEDPIEFIFEDRKSLMSQREVGLDTLAFENALKNALRQAPDVISIGEIRDMETAHTALTMAETGHLVLATLHASNTYQSLERLVSIFSGEKEKQLLMMLSMNLIGMLAQRLIPRQAGGRIAATELLVISARTKELIRNNQISDISEVLRHGEQEGVYSFDQSIYELFAQNLISEENALGFADNRGELKMRMKGFQGSLKQV